MRHHYKDIRDKIAELPKWWDEAGVPRYCEFSPNETNYIYARQVVLMEIACQNCGRRFMVAMSWSGYDKSMGLGEAIRQNIIHYGDPPNIGCCPAGPTMNSIPLRVIEFWEKTHTSRWSRKPKLEKEITPDWVKE